MTLTIGLGCRRGVSEARIAAAVRAAAAGLLQAQPTWTSKHVSQMATIDAKRSESGLLAYCNRHALPLRFATTAALATLSESAASARSDAVLARFGIPSVCEAAALWAATFDATLASAATTPALTHHVQRGDRIDDSAGADTDTSHVSPPVLVLRKMVLDGVTVAIASAPSRLPGIAQATRDGAHVRSADVAAPPFTSLYDFALRACPSR